MTVLALSSCLLALASAAPAAAPSAEGTRARGMVKACEQVRITTGVAFKCPGILVQLSEAKTGSEQEAVDGQVAGLRAAFDGVATVETARFLVAGQERPGARFKVSATAAEGANTEALIVAYAPRPGVARSVTCLMPQPAADTSRKCEAALDALGTVGPGFYLGPDPDHSALKPLFFGRKISVPKSCTVGIATGDGFQITCEHKVSLAFTKQATEAQAKKVLGLLRDDALRGAPGATAQERPCHVGGVSASCQVVSSPDAVVSIGAATVQGQPVVVLCSQEASRKRRHPLCAGVLDP